jgi:glycosyltransferase involved in cell wall biosynthesis
VARVRIALVVQGGADRSGRERVVPALLWLVERLARSHDVHVFALRHEARPAHYPLLGAAVHDLGGRRAYPGLGLVQLAPRLLRWLGRFGRFDVIHAYRGGAPGLLAAIASRATGAPLLLTLDGGELVGLPEIGYGLQLRLRDRFQLRVALRRAGRVTVGSRYMMRLALERGIVPAPEQLPWGVDTALFAPGAAPEGERLIHVANLNAVKDPITLLRAVRRVADVRPAVRLDVVGEDTLGGFVQRSCAELGLARLVTFHGFRTSDAVAGLMRRSALHVVSSLHEAACAAVLEAAACGVPSVGTAVGHVADGHPERARAVPVGDAPALADAILALLGDPDRRRAMGRAALAWARAHDADSTAARFAALYAALSRGARG